MNLRPLVLSAAAIATVAIATSSLFALAQTAATVPALLPAPAPAAPAVVEIPVPTVNAAAYLVVEATSGQVLAEQNTRQKRDPASLTKLMTAYLVFDALHQKQLSLGQRMRVPERAWKAEGSRMFIAPGTPVTVEDMIRGLIIQSGNDAAIALAVAVSGNEGEFVTKMNREAKKLGMADTQYLNPTGLTQQGHYSTAHDLAVLSLALMRDFPQYTKFYAEKSFTFNKIAQENRNRLLFLDPTVDGLKTGHTDAAGWCLITSVNRPPRKLLTVVLGAPSEALRINESRKLIDWAFTAFEGKRLYEAKKPIQQLTVWKANVDSIPVGFNDDVTAVTTTGKRWDITTELTIVEPKFGPLAAGDTVGLLKVKRAGNLIYERNVIAMESAPGAPMWKRMWHSVVLFFKGLVK